MGLKELKDEALRAIAGARDARALEALRVKYLGRQDGALTAILRGLKSLSVEERKKIGPAAQALKQELETAIEEKVRKFAAEGAGRRFIDLSAPGRRASRGHLHPLTLVERGIRRIFLSMNFSVAEGPELETEYYNFDAMNMPKFHPAREMWDTFWIKDGYSHKDKKGKNDRLLLRTHTSPVQVRYMEKHTPPIQIIIPGKMFRYEATDASHETGFYNVEGLMVGKHTTLANFKFVVETFFKKFFGRNIEFRYRPSYFPFVEPGLEVDVKFKGKWLEIMGAGMVHPRVFEYAHYNPRDWQGFAFGMGLDRLAMIKYGIPDIRLFYSGDTRLVKQF